MNLTKDTTASDPRLLVYLKAVHKCIYRCSSPTNLFAHDTGIPKYCGCAPTLEQQQPHLACVVYCFQSFCTLSVSLSLILSLSMSLLPLPPSLSIFFIPFPESSGKQVLYQQMLKPTLAEKYACAEPAMPGCPGNTPFDWLDRTTRVLSLQNDSWENHVGREDRSLSEHVLSTLSYSITCVEERLLSVKHSFADHRRGVSPRSAGRLVGLWLASAKISHATRLLDLFCTERSLAQLLSHSIHCGTEAAVTLQMMRGLLL